MSDDTRIMGIKCDFKKPGELTDMQLAAELLNVAFVEVRLAYTSANDLPGDYRLNFSRDVPALFTAPNLKPLITELNERMAGPARPDDQHRALLTTLHNKLATVAPDADVFYKAEALRKVIDGPNAAENIEQDQLVQVWVGAIQKEILKIAKPRTNALH